MSAFPNALNSNALRFSNALAIQQAATIGITPWAAGSMSARSRPPATASLQPLSPVNLQSCTGKKTWRMRESTRSSRLAVQQQPRHWPACRRWRAPGRWRGSGPPGTRPSTPPTPAWAASSTTTGTCEWWGRFAGSRGALLMLTARSFIRCCRATCKFDNVCINATTGQFEYYIDPQFASLEGWKDGGWGRQGCGELMSAAARATQWWEPQWDCVCLLGAGAPVAFGISGEPYMDFPETMVNPGEWQHARHSSAHAAVWACLWSLPFTRTCAGHARIDTSRSWHPVARRRPFPRPSARVKWAPSDQALLHAFPPALLWNYGWVNGRASSQMPATNAHHMSTVHVHHLLP